MIQATGTITKSDGVTSYVSPLINVYFSSPKKDEPNIIAAQVCKEVTENQVTKIVMISDGQILQTTFIQENPTFEQAQTALKVALETTFPNVTFEIV
jgi:hypothetical protein